MEKDSRELQACIDLSILFSLDLIKEDLRSLYASSK
jgi:hypothetical protein